MQLPKILLKGRSHRTIQTLLSKSKRFPTLTPRPQQFTIQRARKMPPAQTACPGPTKGTTEIRAPCRARREAAPKAGSHRRRAGQRSVGRMPAAMPLLPAPPRLLTDGAGAAPKAGLVARGHGGRAAPPQPRAAPPGRAPGRPLAAGLRTPGLHCRRRGPAGDDISAAAAGRGAGPGGGHLGRGRSAGTAPAHPHPHPSAPAPERPRGVPPGAGGPGTPSAGRCPRCCRGGQSPPPRRPSRAARAGAAAAARAPRLALPLPGAAQSAHAALPGRWSSSTSAFLLLSFAMGAAGGAGLRSAPPRLRQLHGAGGGRWRGGRRPGCSMRPRSPRAR